MGSSGGGGTQVVEVPVYQAADRTPMVTAAVAQDISGQNAAALSTNQQLKRRSGGIAATYNRFLSEQTSGKTKLGQ